MGSGDHFVHLWLCYSASEKNAFLAVNGRPLTLGKKSSTGIAFQLDDRNDRIHSWKVHLIPATM
jgi:hypothetical protein